ncbi:MAG: YesL family protein [Anaerolineae bacterium]
MMIREAMEVFWQTLKDTWEELYSIAIVNLVWLFASFTVVLFPVTAAGMYYVANRVAHGKTFHFSDFIEGIKLYWWRSLLWFLANIVVIALFVVNIMFYSSFEGSWVVVVGGLWLALLVFWLSMQVYFWPLLIEQSETKMLQAWRNAAFLILANPFYAFFIVTFTVVLFAVSTVLTLPLIFVGMGLVAILGNNAVLTLLVKFNLMEEARPTS